MIISLPPVTLSSDELCSIDIAPKKDEVIVTFNSATHCRLGRREGRWTHFVRYIKKVIDYYKNKFKAKKH